jgi:hypothetical protein
MNFNALGKLGISGGIGFLIGLAIVTWVGPTTTGGTALLIAIPIALCTIIGGLISKLFGKKDKSHINDDQDEAERQGNERNDSAED